MSLKPIQLEASVSKAAGEMLFIFESLLSQPLGILLALLFNAVCRPYTRSKFIIWKCNNQVDASVLRQLANLLTACFSHQDPFVNIEGGTEGHCSPSLAVPGVIRTASCVGGKEIVLLQNSPPALQCNPQPLHASVLLTPTSPSSSYLLLLQLFWVPQQK